MLIEEALKFFGKQGCVIVASIDEKGFPHTSCKGIVSIGNNKIYLLDAYQAKTYQNLQRNNKISLTYVDEHRYTGYCVKGTSEIIDIKKIDPEIKALWNEKITERIASRIIKNVQGKKGHKKQPEARLPKPKYMIVFTIKTVVDLSRHSPGEEHHE